MKETQKSLLVASLGLAVGALMGAFGTYSLLEGRAESIQLANHVHVAELVFTSGDPADAVKAQLELLSLAQKLRADAAVDAWQLGVAEMEAHLRIATLNDSQGEHVEAARASCAYAGMRACDEGSMERIRKRLASERAVSE